MKNIVALYLLDNIKDNSPVKSMSCRSLCKQDILHLWVLRIQYNHRSNQRQLSFVILSCRKQTLTPVERNERVIVKIKMTKAVNERTCLELLSLYWTTTEHLHNLLKEWVHFLDIHHLRSTDERHFEGKKN